MNRLIAWFAHHPIAANLFMLLVIFGGLLSLPAIKKEVFASFSTDTLSVTVAYPGGTPREVEEDVVARIEERVQGLEGIRHIRSVAAENLGTVVIELSRGTDLRKTLLDVKTRVDAIDSFPPETEAPIVEEMTFRRQVIRVAVSGETDERTLKRLGEQVREDLMALPGLSQVELVAVRPDEISIEVSEEALRRFGLTFDHVAEAVRKSSVTQPGGSLETRGGDILLRTDREAERGPELEELPLLTLQDGSRLRLGEVARVVDGFARSARSARFDGKPAVLVQVFRVGDQSALEIARQVKRYVEETRRRMPQGIELTTWQDDTVVLTSRLRLLLDNGFAGLVLVTLVLACFLRLSVAAWVALGIPISLLGALAVMPVFDISINLMSLFAFIIVLGIVVDDAIVIGENAHRHLLAGGDPVRAVIAGTQEVAVPVVFGVLTTLAAFAPLLLITGSVGDVIRSIPILVIATLSFSLAESLFILPNHLAHHGRSLRPPGQSPWGRVQGAMSAGLDRFSSRVYRPLIERALAWRYLTATLALVAFAITLALIGSDRIHFTFLPHVESDNVVAILTFPQGTPTATTAAAARQIERAALATRREVEESTGAPVVLHALTSLGEQPYRTAQAQGGTRVDLGFVGDHMAEVHLELVPSEERSVSSQQIAGIWRRKVGDIPGATELFFTSTLFAAGSPISVELTGPDLEELRQLAGELKEELHAYPGLQEIADSFRPGKEALELDITPEAEAAGLTLADLARQVRQAYFGEEAQKLQRGRDEVKVMVRLPAASRRSWGSLDELRVRTPEGFALPFSTVASVRRARQPAVIERRDRRRFLRVTADVAEETTSARQVLGDLEREILPRLLQDHPRVRHTFEGQQEQQRETFGGLQRGFVLALLAIYALLAIPFRSYLQPLVAISAVPFGLIGVVLGHVILGHDLTVFSFIGFVALTGIVVNDSLVLMDFINCSIDAGTDPDRAVREAGQARLRPVLLTSLTTFAGLAPLILERSVQAKFLVPMAIALGFGVLFATAVTLLIVPVGYALLGDAKALLARGLPPATKASTARSS